MSPTLFAFAAAALVAQAPDLSMLSPEQRNTFQRIAREEFCSCQSALTVAGCLELRPDCRLAAHLGQIIVRGLVSGASSDALLAFMSQRVMGPFCSQPKRLDLPDAPSIGPAAAPIVLVEFADFRCGHCKRMAPWVEQALQRWRGKVRFVFVPLPLGDHPLSMAAAEAALAAHAQGKLEPVAKALFAHEGEFDEASITAIARKAGLDMKRFEREMQAHTWRTQVRALKEAGLRAGVEGTPTFFINGRRFEPDEDVLTFATRFQMELDRNQGSCQ